MNRCASVFFLPVGSARRSWPQALMLLLGSALLLAPSQAQVRRHFPATALRGTVVFSTPPEIVLNNVATRLSPGGRIRDTRNMLVMPATLTGQKWVVHYTLDMMGQVHDSWLLREDEIANQPWPRTPLEAQTWQFDPIGQTWTRP